MTSLPEDVVNRRFEATFEDIFYEQVKPFANTTHRSGDYELRTFCIAGPEFPGRESTPKQRSAGVEHSTRGHGAGVARLPRRHRSGEAGHAVEAQSRRQVLAPISPPASEGRRRSECVPFSLPDRLRRGGKARSRDHKGPSRKLTDCRYCAHRNERGSRGALARCAETADRLRRFKCSSCNGSVTGSGREFSRIAWQR